MIKKALIRAFSGFAFAVLIGQFVSISISLSLGDGQFHQFIPDFRALFATDLQAVIVQTILTGLVGTAFAVSGLIFELDKWSILKQYVVHFLATAMVWVPVAYLCWIPQNKKGITICLFSFFATYVITWLIQYFVTPPGQHRNQTNRKAPLFLLSYQESHLLTLPPD